MIVTNTATATADAVRITNRGTGLSLKVEDSTNPDSSSFVVDASGNVGVKTASPSTDFEVNGNAKATTLTIGTSTALTGVATDAEAIAGTSTTLAVTPSGANANRMDPSYRDNLSGADFTQVVSGSGATFVNALGVQVATGTSASSYGIRRIGGTGFPFQRGENIGVVDFTDKIEVSFRAVISGNMAADQTARVTFGKVTTDNNGDLARKGFGIRIVGTDPVDLQAHDGTNLVNVASSFSYTAGAAFDVRIVSQDGSVTLYIDDVSVATTTSGPTGLNAASTHNNLQFEIESVTAQTSRSISCSGIVSRFAT